LIREIMGSGAGGIMTEIKSYRDLKVWQQGMGIAEAVYALTGRFPRHELFGLTSQLRRASVSVPANIAEGYSRDSTRPYANALRIAQGSLKELETHLLLAVRVGIANDEQADPIMQEADALGRMLRTLIKKIETSA
jgi:four helix bundle protein